MTVRPTGAGMKWSRRCTTSASAMCTTDNRGICVTTEICKGAIALASGRYCILMGNDDCLAGNNVLERLFELIGLHENVGVVIPNYRILGGSGGRRVSVTRLVRGGPRTASRCFRNFSFISGVTLQRDRAVAHATAQWDGLRCIKCSSAAAF